MGLQSLDALAMIMQTLLPLATTLTPALEVRSIDGVDWASVLSAVIDGSPIVYRDDGEKRLCPVTFASQPQRLLFECDAAVPSLSSMMDGLNDTYAGVGLSVHLNGQVAPPDVPAMHLDLHAAEHKRDATSRAPGDNYDGTPGSYTERGVGPGPLRALGRAARGG